MTVDEIASAVLDGSLESHEGFQVNDPRYVDGVLVVDGFAALPVAAISSGVCRDVDVEVVDPAGLPLGTLCFTRSLGNVARTDLTKWQFVAFLADAEVPEINEPHYGFKSDYLIVEPERLAEYRQSYESSAPVWGRFSHEPIASLEHVTEVAKITAIPGISIPSSHHREAFNRYLHANNPSERFLRVYQSIELLFDYVLVKKIKGLGDDIAGFSSILADFGKTELDRLKAIMREFCGNASAIASALEVSSEFAGERDEIFFQHGKAGNPYSDNEKWEKLTQCLDGASMNEPSLLSKGLFNKKQQTFDRVVLELAAYWIYRVRCSIAHNRVGEFLLEDKHTEFVAKFAEPLVLEVAKQIFASEGFKSL